METGFVFIRNLTNSDHDFMFSFRCDTFFNHSKWSFSLMFWAELVD